MPNKATNELLNIIQNEINNYSKISLIGHSYGGIVLAKLLEKTIPKTLNFISLRRVSLEIQG